MEQKYIAIKVRCFDYWIWFERTKVTENYEQFIGTGGWGKGGACTNITIDSNEITGRIESDTLQYN